MPWKRVDGTWGGLSFAAAVTGTSEPWKSSRKAPYFHSSPLVICKYYWGVEAQTDTHFGLKTEEVVRGQSSNLSNSETEKR